MPFKKIGEQMNIFFYIIIFLIGITFGSFYTLAVYRIPKGQDITHTHSYCPKCNHKLNFIDLIPIFSYIFLKGKCRYCNQKIRPRYLILEVISGIVFVVFAYLIDLNIYQITIIKIIEYAFLTLYITFIVLISGIDKEHRKINKPVLMYGVILSIIYIVYLYIIEKTSIYRYVIYLVLFAIILILDTITLRKKAKNNYTYGILLMLIIMIIFTGEYTVTNSIIITLLGITIYLIVKRLSQAKNRKIDTKFSTQIPIAFYLSMSNIIYFMFSLICYKFLI